MASQGLARMRHQVERFKMATKNARAKAGEVTEALLTLGETAGTAFAFGYYEGAVTSPKQFEFFGVPAPLLAGLGAHAFALLGVGRGMDEHLRAIGNGALASHLNGIGRQMGKAHPIKTGEDDSPAALPAGRPHVGAGLTADDLAAYARA
jgi:hypothetical protein